MDNTELKNKIEIAKANTLLSGGEAGTYKALESELVKDQNMPIYNYGLLIIEHTKVVANMMSKDYKKFEPNILKHIESTDKTKGIIRGVIKKIDTLRTKLKSKENPVLPVAAKSKTEAKNYLLGTGGKPPKSITDLEKHLERLTDFSEGLTDFYIGEASKLDSSSISALTPELTAKLKTLESQINAGSDRAQRSRANSLQELKILQETLQQANFEAILVEKFGQKTSDTKPKDNSYLANYQEKLDSARKVLEKEQKNLINAKHVFAYWSNWYNTQGTINTGFQSLNDLSRSFLADLKKAIDTLASIDAAKVGFEGQLDAVDPDQVEKDLKALAREKFSLLSPKSKKPTEFTQDFEELAQLYATLEKTVTAAGFVKKPFLDIKSDLVKKAVYLSKEVLIPFRDVFKESQLGKAKLKLQATPNNKDVVKEDKVDSELKAAIEHAEKAVKDKITKYEKELANFTKAKQLQI